MWVVDIEKMLDHEADQSAPPAEEWRSHYIFRVPPHFKMVHGSAFKPQAVTLGPFHHDRDSNAIMEGHKRRAVRHLLWRAGKTLRDLAAGVEDVANELEDAYAGLDSEWLGQNRGRFLEMMIADGCFLLEVMRNYAIEMNKEDSNDYTPSDPVFSPHAVVHIAAFLQRDMLMMENQLPLRLLQRIVAVEGRPSVSERTHTDTHIMDEASINKEVLRFLGINHEEAAASQLGLHPLDIYRRGLLGSVHGSRAHPISPNKNGDDELDAPRSAQKLWEAGIRFQRSRTDLLDDVGFDEGKRRLEMPRVLLDDSTEHKFRNMMAFEALHAGGTTGNDVTAFVLFLKDMVDSVDDVARLRKAGVLRHDLASSDGAAVELLQGLTRDVAKTRESRLCAVRDEVELYCRASWQVFAFKSWAKLRKTYFTNLWGTVALTVSIFLLITDVMQTAYAVMSYELTKHRHG
ncbi:unnamed protein product [Urochloa decumbens]|uniref:Uncharacterized protein n=1 Tax=Urochloa decumbens TaxID=240449 RepID=A0ABC9B4I0_9POAL